MNRARRREIWAEALVDALQAGRAGDRRDLRLPDPVVRAAIRGLLDDTQTAMGDAASSDERDKTAMGDAASSDERDKLYERHRALSEIIRRLDRPAGEPDA